MFYYKDLDTPSLIIDEEIMLDNISYMQDYSNKYKVKLRPHTKTHKMPYLAKLQVEAGASGITVAKLGEAEVMADHGIRDIFIANEIVGKRKLEGIKNLSESINISFGLDSIEHVEAIEEVFDQDRKAKVLIEIEVGENRSGVIEEENFIKLLKYILKSRKIELKGIFSHEGFTYGVKDIEELKKVFIESQKRTLRFAELAKNLGHSLEVVSIGATPPSIHNLPILEGITEIRPGTYILMDMGQANALGSIERCAASVLTTVISRPTEERVITDLGAKGITMQRRDKGLCANKGLGLVKGFGIYIDRLFDEHAIINNREFRDKVRIGDKLEVIPNHICPVCNLYDEAYLVSKNGNIREVEISCRGKLK